MKNRRPINNLKCNILFLKDSYKLNIAMKELTLLILLFILKIGYIQAQGNDINLIPKPSHLIMEKGAFSIKDDLKISLNKEDDELRNVAELLRMTIKESFNLDLPIVIGNTKGRSIKIVCNTAPIEDESYQLNINKKGIEIKSKTAKGAFYATQTLRQIFNSSEKKDNIPLVEIKDSPRFKYRGMMLDVGRHLYSIDFIKTFIDQLAYHKLNVFHWHLTEDQGWRIEIKKYPNLTNVGSIRNQTIIGHAGSSNVYDNLSYGGYYTQEEIKEIVKYAQERFVTVIPEIELPGHAQAALASYPSLGCTEGPYEVATTFGVSDEVYCAGNDKVFSFLEGVLDEVIDLFPSEYIHIGGDECPKIRWEKCQKCQSRIKNEKLHNEHELQSYFITRIEKYLNTKGKKIIGWDEILEGGLAPNATVMSWRGISGGIEAAQQNHNVIMSPNTHVYFDHYQGDPNNEPLAIGGMLPIKRVYDFEPVPNDLSKEQQKYIIGAQANVWSEYMKTEENVEYMVFPRIDALSEVLWTQKENKDWEDFKFRLFHRLNDYDKLGLNYAKHILNPEIEMVSDFENSLMKVNISTANPNARIYYSLNGETPTKNSIQYQGSFILDHSAEVKAVSIYNGKESNIVVKPFSKNVATTKKIKLLTAPEKRFIPFGEKVLTDGLRGGNKYDNGAWVGYNEGNIEMIIDLKDKQIFNVVTIGNLINKGLWIFAAKSVEIYSSNDDSNYTLLAKKELFDEQQINIEDGIINHTIPFKKTEARYVKMIIERVKTLPKWHPGKGGNAYLFIDEVMIDYNKEIKNTSK